MSSRSSYLAQPREVVTPLWLTAVEAERGRLAKENPPSAWSVSSGPEQRALPRMLASEAVKTQLLAFLQQRGMLAFHDML